MLHLILILTGLVLIVADVQVMMTTPPANTTSGVSFAIFTSATVSPTGTTSPVASNNSVNDRIDQLRVAGQKAPSGLPIVTVSLSNPWMDPAAQFFAPYAAYVDSSSPFNLAPRLVMHQFNFPLGAECSLEWGDSRLLNYGNLTVLTAEFDGKKRDVIFCYLPTVTSVVISLAFLKEFGLGMCGSNNVISAC